MPTAPGGPSFAVLGPLEVRRGGALVDVGSPMVRLLLARLLVDANRVVSVGRLIDDLWDTEPPPSAGATLQSYVSLLRRALEPDRAPRTPPGVVVTRAPGYVLVVGTEEVDAGRFVASIERGRSLLAAGDPAAALVELDDALARWRGDPYADAEERSFVVGERRRLGELHAAASEDRIAALLDLGRHRYVLGDLQALVRDAPYRERSWELLVLAQHRSGRQVEALRTFQAARRALVEHAGVEPGPRLVELERRVAAQDPSLDWRPPTAPEPPGATTDTPPTEPAPLAAARRSAATQPGGERATEVEPGAEPGPAAGVGPRSAPANPMGVPEVGGALRPPLVGRDDAVASFSAVLDRVASGRGGVLLVGGDAGIGKTRLVEEMVAPAAERGIRAVWGRSSDTEGAPGYWPWTRALGQLLASADERAVGRAGPQLTHVLPELGPAESATGDDDGAARFAVQRAVVAFLEGVCATTPTMIVLDDIHWADASSLRLLAALAPELTHLPLLVVGTYRPTEAAANPALADALGRVARQLDTDRIELHGLDRRSVAAHLDAAGVSASPRLVAEVHDRSGGNPFFVTELTRLIVSQRTGAVPPDGGAVARVPHAVGDVTRQRLARLPAASAELLSLASVVGRSSDLRVLSTLAGLDVDDVLDRLEPAIADGLASFDPERPGSLRFAHDLQREAIHHTLSPATRARLHRRVAAAMAAEVPVGDASDAGRIAHHYAEAMVLGTAPDVLHWARLAADHASARGADDEAVEALVLAVRAHAIASPGDAAGRFELTMALARARRSAWDLAGAREAIDAAIALAEQLDDPDGVLDAGAITAGVGLWNWSPPGVVPHELVRPLERALARRPDGIDVTRIRGLGALGVALRYERSERGRELTDAAVEVAEHLGDPAELARALNNAYVARWWRPNFDELLAIADRSLALPGLQPEVRAVALMHRMLVLSAVGDLERLADDVAEAASLRAVVRYADVAAQLDLNGSMWAAMHDRTDDARELLERGYRTRYEDSTMWAGEWVYHLGRMGIGDLTDDELDHQATSLAAIGVDDVYDLVRPTAVLALLRCGRLAEARRLAGGGPRLGPCWAWLFGVAQWVEIAVVLDLDILPALVSQLLPYQDDLVVAGSNLACFGSMHRLLGLAAAHLGDASGAELHLRAALATHERLGLPRLATESRRLLDRHVGGSATADRSGG